MATDETLPPWARRLRTERDRRGWNKHEMARRLLDTAGIEQTPIRIKSLVRQVSWWEDGKHYPRDWDAAYATAFETTVAKLFGTKPAYLQPATARSVDGEGACDEQDDDMYRRAAIQLLGALSAGVSLPPGALETVLARLDRAIGDRDELHLDGWDETAAEYRQLVLVQPAGSLIGDLSADLVALGGLLAREQPSAIRAGLLRVSGELTGHLAWEFGDIGERRAARQSWRTARRSADASGDHRLSAWLRNNEADSAISTGRPDATATRLIDEAIRLAPQPRPALAVAYGLRAKLRALHGDRVGAAMALRDCATVRDRLGDQAGNGWLLTNDAYVRVITDDQAATALERALGQTMLAGPRTSLGFVHALHLVKSREVGEGLKCALVHAQERPLTARRKWITGQILAALPDGKSRALPPAQELRALAASAR
jgi:hypothetical protein